MGNVDPAYALYQTTMQQCTKGHEWESSYNGPAFWTLSFGEGLEIGDLCPFCLKERVEELLADVGREKGEANG